MGASGGLHAVQHTSVNPAVSLQPPITRKQGLAALAAAIDQQPLRHAHGGAAPPAGLLWLRLANNKLEGSLPAELSKLSGRLWQFTVDSNEGITGAWQSSLLKTGGSELWGGAGGLAQQAVLMLLLAGMAGCSSRAEHPPG